MRQFKDRLEQRSGIAAIVLAMLFPILIGMLGVFL